MTQNIHTYRTRKARTKHLLRGGNFQMLPLSLHRFNLTQPLTHNDVCTTAQDHGKTAFLTHRRRTRNQRGKVLPIHMLDVRAAGLDLFKGLQMAAQRFEARDEPILIDVQQFLKLVFPNKRSVGKKNQIPWCCGACWDRSGADNESSLSSSDL